ncbi:MAG: hypothetical protein QXH07_02990 [Thermoplasmata archaeon]
MVNFKFLIIFDYIDLIVSIFIFKYFMLATVSYRLIVFTAIMGIMLIPVLIYTLKKKLNIKLWDFFTAIKLSIGSFLILIAMFLFSTENVIPMSSFYLIVPFLFYGTIFFISLIYIKDCYKLITL